MRLELSDQLELRVRSRPFPHGFEGRVTELRHLRVFCQLLQHVLALAVEVVDEYEAGVEQPEVVARKHQAGGVAA
ncbi:hypothetical protein Sfulv_37630 [Streptomyces fulvorobeus]|uniref:Uncharacterized protein n=1 Tax=Streptomyces fulvorobeus TaxID=284028 RepID=A0A7J0C932_9ACTN|nr:hypothetical protein Sfulv_37630 [Streptomyces fulvorobeus]